MYFAETHSALFLIFPHIYGISYKKGQKTFESFCLFSSPDILL